MAEKKDEKNSQVIAADLSRQWTRIQKKLTDSIRPEALRATLSNPWVMGTALGFVGLGVGYLLRRRSSRAAALPTDNTATQPAGEAPPLATDTSDEASAETPGQKTGASRPYALNPLIRAGLVAGIDALEARLTKAAPKAAP